MAGKTIPQILEEIREDICINYCKYPEQYEKEHGSNAETRLLTEKCFKCPTCKLLF